MRKHNKKTVNQTFSIPLGISQELHAYIKRRDMSNFVSEAIKKELEHKKEILRNAYLAANNDAGQKEAEEEWKDTISDGLDGW